MSDLVLAIWGVVLVALSALAIAAVLRPGLLEEIAGLIDRSGPLAFARRRWRTRPAELGLRPSETVLGPVARLPARGLATFETGLLRVRLAVAWAAGSLADMLGAALPGPARRGTADEAPPPGGDPPVTEPGASGGAEVGIAAANVLNAGVDALNAGAVASLPPAGSTLTSSTEDGEGTVLRQVLLGNRPAFERLVAQLAGSDPSRRDRLEGLLASFLEAVLERALDAGLIDPPPAHPFWGAFSRDQGRAILAALASLGFRFDGLDGWLDGRVPGRRDLSVAVGYAGLDPFRLRSWPAPAEMPRLVRGATIAGAEYLEMVAPGLTLAELAAALGPQALSLAELWLHWDRARPLLLSETPDADHS